MKKAELTLFLFLGFAMSSMAQDIQFTQFYANPLYLNPAFAGSTYCPRICLNYRNQWPNLSGTYVSYSASYDRYVDALSGGLGILVTSDNQARGTLKTTTASLMYSYSLPVTRSFSIKAALQATYFQKAIDRSKLNFGDMIDARRGFVWNTNEVVPASNKQNADFSAGILGYSKHYFFGVAANHITQPDEGLIKRHIAQYIVSAAAKFYTAQPGGLFCERAFCGRLMVQEQRCFYCADRPSERSFETGLQL